ncbi:MAG TPA: carboxypeptidase-like regulatory domain-containing protein [Bryobacteraceae bacterium]|nr:carboxypeptidase-like regulatory domain-containing protein [Bryobacteraceae bacterium]
MQFRILLGLVVLAVSAFADTPMTTIRIEVKSYADKPIDRASVIVQFVEGRSIVKLGKKIMTRWEVRTNQDGIAKIPPIPQGKIRVQVIAKGYQTYGNIHEVDEEAETISIKLNPPQPQFTAH